MRINEYLAHANKAGYKIVTVVVAGRNHVAIEEGGKLEINPISFRNSDQEALKKELLKTHKKKYDETK